MTDTAKLNADHVADLASRLLRFRVVADLLKDESAREVFGEGLYLPGHPSYPNMAHTAEYEPARGMWVYRMVAESDQTKIVGHVVWCAACMGGCVLHFVPLAGETVYLR